MVEEKHLPRTWETYTTNFWKSVSEVQSFTGTSWTTSFFHADCELILFMKIKCPFLQCGLILTACGGRFEWNVSRSQGLWMSVKSKATGPLLCEWVDAYSVFQAQNETKTSFEDCQRVISKHNSQLSFSSVYNMIKVSLRQGAKYPMYCHSETALVLINNRGQDKNVSQSRHFDQKTKQKLAAI